MLNYEALQATWEEVIDVVHESEVKARINDIPTIMNTFDFLFDLKQAERKLTVGDMDILSLLCKYLAWVV